MKAGVDSQGDLMSERPLLFVDINLGDDQVERIVVYEGNTAAELALEFSNKHGLDEETNVKLKDLIE
jgi:hypothetical protein